ncbi:MAG: hypothetical protein R3F17_07960 [Planctomycetota bacterium]
MNAIANFLIVLGFCLGSLGAAGFHSPAKSATPLRLANELQSAEGATAPPQFETLAKALEGATDDVRKQVGEVSASRFEPKAEWYFGAGLGLFLLGVVLARKARKASAADHEQRKSGGQELSQRIESVHNRLTELSMLEKDYTPTQVRDALAELHEGEMYELTSRFEQWSNLLGFDRYARIWKGVADGERLSNRAWTMYTDGFPREGREELAYARAAFEEALDATRSA